MLNDYLQNLSVPCMYSCQFAVKAGKDYSVHAADPDVMVSWDLIEEVVSCCYFFNVRFVQCSDLYLYNNYQQCSCCHFAVFVWA